LKLIKNESLSDKESNFWNTCPKSMEYLPSNPCELGTSCKSSNKSPECPWYINSQKHNYCFWKFVKENSNIDGSMKEYSHSDIARLLSLPNTKINLIIKESLEALVNSLVKHGLVNNTDNLEEYFEQIDFNFSDLTNDMR
jgi:hypothetical protein